MEWDYGDLNGHTRAELRRRAAGVEHLELLVPHGESLEDVAARAARVLVRIAATPAVPRFSPTATSCASSPPATSNCRPAAARHFALATGPRLGARRRQRLYGDLALEYLMHSEPPCLCVLGVDNGYAAILVGILEAQRAAARWVGHCCMKSRGPRATIATGC